MSEPAPESLVVLLGAPPMPGELIASYLRYRLPKVAVKLYASCADLKPGAASARGFVLIETAARNAPNIAEAIAKIRSDHPQTPILVASASPDAGSAMRAMRRGAQGFIPHLTPLSNLVNALQMVLDGQTCFPRLVPADGRADRTAQPLSPSPRPADQRAPNGPSDCPPVSVELAMLGGEPACAPEARPDSGPRRREAAEKWIGPKRHGATTERTG
jgi:hypothetical protein